MAETKYQIFISSTYKDLIKERRKAQETILLNGHIPLGMELFPASPSLWSIIENQIKEADYYVLIVAGRYGTIMRDGPDKGMSYTEIEYEYAKKYNIPILPFVKTNYKNTSHYKKSTPQVQKRIEAFIKKLSSEGRSISYWQNSDNLATEVSSGIARSIKSIPRVGWQRSHIPEPIPIAESIYFDCMYYSFIHHRPKNFSLTINIGSNGKIQSVEEVGFHEGANVNITYKGSGFANNGYLYLNLKGEMGDLFDLMLISGGAERSLKVNDIMFGHLRGISSFDPGKPYIVNCEFIAIKKHDLSGDWVISYDKVESLKRFLMINRVSYRVKTRQLHLPADWENLSCRHVVISSLKHLIGTYRVLTPIKPDVFIQSLLTIDEDLVCHLFTKNIPSFPKLFPEKQVCLIRSSNLPENTGKLNLTMHQKDGIRVVSNIMLDTPRPEEMDEVIIGSYCNAGKPVHRENIRPSKRQKENPKSTDKMGTKAGFFMAIKWSDKAWKEAEARNFILGEINLKDLKQESTSNKLINKMLNSYRNKKDTLFFNGSSPY